MRTARLLVFGSAVLVLIAGLTLISTAANDREEEEDNIQMAELPAAVQETVTKLLGGAPVTQLTREVERGQVLYEVEYSIDQSEYSAEIAADGQIVEIEQEVTEAQLPAAVLSALRARYPGARIAEAESVQSFFYEVDLVVNGGKKEVRIYPTGAMENEEEDDDEEDDDENEETVALDQVPAAVRATLQAQAAGGTIGEIEKEVENGRTLYEAEVVINGQQWEIEIAEDGTLIEKELDDDDEEDDD